MPVRHKSALLNTPTYRNYRHGRANKNKSQRLVPESDLSWEIGREVCTQATLSWLLRLSGWIKAFWSSLQRKKCIQLVNSATWLNKQFLHWKKNLPRDAFGMPGKHTGKKNKGEIVPGEYVVNVTVRPASTGHYSVPGGFSSVCSMGFFNKKKKKMKIPVNHTATYNIFLSKVSVDNCKLPILEELWLSKVWDK